MFRLKDSVDYLPEILSQNGYFTSCDLISEKVVSSRGFDIYQSHDEYKDDLTIRHTELIKKSIEKANGKPIFCFLQFSRIHTVTVSEVLKKYDWDSKEFYDKKDDNLKSYEKVFQESCEYALKIKKTIEDLGQSQNTIIVFFSDHGTGVGERYGERNYGVYLYEETLRTFYLFVGPKIPKNKVLSSLFSSIDIFPTILDLCNLKTPSKLSGQSLLNYLIGNKIPQEERFTFSETGGLQGPHPSPMNPNVFCVKNSNYKLIFFETPNKWELYDLKNDPLEKHNLYDQGLNIEEELKKELLSWKNKA